MSSTLERLIEPIRHSPQLVEAVDLLQQQIRSERERRERFYEEMTPDQKIEFIDGEVMPQSPARNVHLDVTRWIAALLGSFVDSSDQGEVKVEKCLCVFPRNDYEPDIVFFGPEKVAAFGSATMKFPVPDLAVEVLSSSTEHRDRGVKFEDFQAHGVREYWIVDAERAVIEQYVLGADGYDLVLKSGSGELRSVVVDGFIIPVRACFSKEEILKALRGLLGE
ncbi:MAG: Uma2 family endonuclease [Chthoniobacteraceae bacterium]